ncbi:putative porin, partial [Phaeocystidibacter luteus]|uniref:putative porin n=1 Tax=Phaeocystidibacter luteus TaxID=911197 RepID=UPI001CB8B8B7
ITIFAPVIKTLTFTALALLASFSLKAQQDSIPSDSARVVPTDTLTFEEAYSALNYRNWDDLSYRPIDSLLEVGGHWTLNEWTRDLYGQLSWANLATPLTFLVYQPNEEIGVRPGFQSYFNGWTRAKELRFYDVKAPLSGIRYLSGYQRGQLFGGYFAVNANERFNIFFDYERASARGDYFSQDNLYDRINASTHYRTKNNKYAIQAATTWNLNRGRESGGITDLDGFSNPDSLISDRELVNVRYYNSFFKARRLDLAVSQTYLPFADSTEAKGIGLYHEGDLDLGNRTFTSTDSILGNYFIDSTMTMDSTHYVTTNQELGLVFRSGLKSFTYVKAGLGYQYGRLSNPYTERTEGSVFVSGELRGDAEKFDWMARGKLFVGGTQNGSFDAHGQISFDIYDFGFVGFATFQQQAPSLQSEEWYANDFIWSNDFQSTFYQKLGGRLNYEKYASFSLNLQNWSRPIYYDYTSLPAQLDGTMQLIQAELDLQIPLTSWLTATSRTTLQLTSASQDIFRLPTWVNRSGLFGEWEVFDGALKAYTGFEAITYSSYRANRYNPVTGVFFLHDDLPIGGFVYVNAIAGFRIGTAQIYILAENVGEGLFNRAYYAAPYYPMADRTIHLGIRWRFFN